VVAHEATYLGVLHQGDRAAKTLHRAAAVAAHHVSRQTPAVQVEDRLLLALEGARDDLHQAPRQRLRVALGGLVAHVDELHDRVVAAYPPGHPSEGYLPAARAEVCGHARRRRTRDELRSRDRRQPARDPAGLIARGPA